MQKTAWNAGRLRFECALAECCFGGAQFSQELPLPGMFVGELPEERRQDFRGIGGPGFGGRQPEFAQGWTVELREERRVVSEPDGKQLQQGVVAPSVHPVFPHLILHVAGPAPDAHELPMEKVGRVVAGNAKPFHRVIDGRPGVVRQRLHPLPEMAQAEHFGIAIDQGFLAPRCKERQPPPGESPGRLASIEILGAKLRDRLGDRRRPRGAVRAIHRFRDGKNFVSGRCCRLPGQRAFELLDVESAERLRPGSGQSLPRLYERRRQVGVEDVTRGMLLPVKAGRHLHAAGRDPADQLTRFEKGPVREADEGIHGDKVLQRPERGEALARGTRGCEDGAWRRGLVGVGKGGSGDVHEGVRVVGSQAAVFPREGEREAVGDGAEVEALRRVDIERAPQPRGRPARELGLHEQHGHEEQDHQGHDAVFERGPRGRVGRDGRRQEFFEGRMETEKRGGRPRSYEESPADER